MLGIITFMQLMEILMICYYFLVTNWSHKLIFYSSQFLELCDSRFNITIWLSTMQPNLMSMVQYLLKERSGMLKHVFVWNVDKRLDTHILHPLNRH
jgi:hypothetical protein